MWSFGHLVIWVMCSSGHLVGWVLESLLNGSMIAQTPSAASSPATAGVTKPGSAPPVSARSINMTLKPAATDVNAAVLVVRST